MIENAAWPLFGWSDDIRPALAKAQDAGRPAALATLFSVEGSAPRGAGAQMLFDGARASGYFSGDCIEGDVAAHAADVLKTGKAQRLHYGMGSPWMDIRLRCGGALHILLERIEAGSSAALSLLAHAHNRQPCLWISDGSVRSVQAGTGPLLCFIDHPLRITRRFDPPRRIVISGGDPGSLALAKLAVDAQFETILIRPDGPASPPPFDGITYCREDVAAALHRIGIDSWTAFIGATHEDHHDLPACIAALRGGAAWVGMIGAKSRASGRLEALRSAGATSAELATLHLSPGISGLGKSPWEVATGIMAQLMQAMNPASDGA